MDRALLWVWKSWFKANVIPPDIREGIWNSHGVRFSSCENMVDGTKLFWDNRARLLLPRKKSLLSLVLGSLVLGLQLGESLHHPRDESLVLAFHLGLGIPLLHN